MLHLSIWNIILMNKNISFDIFYYFCAVFWLFFQKPIVWQGTIYTIVARRSIHVLCNGAAVHALHVHARVYHIWRYCSYRHVHRQGYPPRPFYPSHASHCALIDTYFYVIVWFCDKSILMGMLLSRRGDSSSEYAYRITDDCVIIGRTLFLLLP